MQTLTISKPDDFHLHLRDGAAMASVINYSAAQFSRAIIMPNLVPPIINVDMAMLYRERILHCVDKKFNFEPLMTLYLTDDTSPSEITTAARNEHIKAIKYYPAGATTNSESGVTDLKKTYKGLSLLLPTSGSMGSPKFVKLTEDNLIQNAKSIISYLKINKKKRTVTTMPFSYSYMMSIINTYIETGASIYVTESSIIEKDFWEGFRII